MNAQVVLQQIDNILNLYADQLDRIALDHRRAIVDAVVARLTKWRDGASIRG